MRINLELCSKGELVKAIEELDKYTAGFTGQIERTVFEGRMRIASDRVRAAERDLKLVGPYSTRKNDLKAKLEKVERELRELESLLLPTNL